jgi:SAM-dependent methyltransferase
VFLSRMQELGWAVTGIETDARAARFARERFGVEVVEGSLESAEFPADTFDAVILSHVIEHVFEPVSLLRECGRVLKPGGKLIVLTPNTGSFGHRVFREAWRGLEPPRHLHIFNRLTLDAAVREAGLGVAALTTISRMMQGIWYMSRLIERASAGRPKKNSLFDYVASYVMRAVETLLGIWWKDAGEEIFLVAVKPIS